MSGRSKKPWKRISGFKGGGDDQRVTLFLDIYASPMSMGWGDAFAVADCWRDAGGNWMHLYNGKATELRREYVTHFAPTDALPATDPHGNDLDWWRG